MSNTEENWNLNANTHVLMGSIMWQALKLDQECDQDLNSRNFFFFFNKTEYYCDNVDYPEIL